MKKIKLIGYRLSVIALSLALTSMLFNCSSDVELAKPTFSEITISPVKDVYHVGDLITLTVRQLNETPSEIKAETAWFYYPDGATQDDRILFVNRTVDTGEFISSVITINSAGTVQLAFYTQYDYPKYKYDGVTLYKTITVVE
jgi:hypothetical protein